MNSIEHLGWNAHFEAHFAPHSAAGLAPARVAVEHPQLYRLLTPDGECLAAVSGKLRHEATGRASFPAVGDWVAYAPEPAGRGVIHAVLPRRGKFSRAAAGGGREQIVAANVDTVFLVSALGADYNPRRLERYLALAWESGASPVVVLNKADLCADPAPAIAEAEGLSPGVPVHAISCAAATGLEALASYMAPGRTVALLGSSGVGKSSLLNRLTGEVRHAVQSVRIADDKGKHTTTYRELVPLPSGGLLIDTPGMRELGIWEADTGLGETFSDVEALAGACRFRDCTHEHEPACAVRGAIASGALSPERLASYRKLSRELAYQARRHDAAAQRAEKARWKSITEAQRQAGKDRE